MEKDKKISLEAIQAKIFEQASRRGGLWPENAIYRQMVSEVGELDRKGSSNVVDEIIHSFKLNGKPMALGGWGWGFSGNSVDIEFSISAEYSNINRENLIEYYGNYSIKINQSLCE